MNLDDEPIDLTGRERLGKQAIAAEREPTATMIKADLAMRSLPLFCRFDIAERPAQNKDSKNKTRTSGKGRHLNMALDSSTSRTFTVAAAQLGPIARHASRAQAVARLIALLREAHARQAGLVVFPELALTSFFPRWYIEDEAELDSFYEQNMPNVDTQPLFDVARQLGVGFYLGYAERLHDPATGTRRFNTSILVDRTGNVVGKYRKVHLPGHAKYDRRRAFQHLEKKYFEPGDLGFPVWRTMGGLMGMCICNDRRWPETWRCMGLQGVELVALGYNTPTQNAVAAESEHLRMFHNHLSMQAGAYQNGTWVVASAKAGNEEGVDMMGGSCIIAPTGEIVALANTVDDEVITAQVDLDRGRYLKETVFKFADHRRIEHYKIIAEQTGVVPPGA